MRTTAIALGTLVAALSFGSIARAQETPAPDKKLDDASAKTEARKPVQSLVFDATPAGWKPRPPEPRGYVCDYDLPAAEGDSEPARVNVLYYPLDVETYRSRLAHRWTQADGKPHTKETRRSAELEANGVKLYSEDLSGTFAAKDAPAKPGFRLVAILIAAPRGSWTAWLFGPEKTVEKHREEYSKWVRSVRVVDPKPVAPKPVDPKPAESDATAEVRFVHGAPEHGVPGPWALTGYRIGKDALERLGISRERSWEIVVTHRSPSEVRYTCMLDGLLAATGASPGKMNLLHETTADEDGLETLVLHKPTQRLLVYRLKAELREKIREIAPADFPKAQKELEGLKNDELFDVTETKARRQAD